MALQPIFPNSFAIGKEASYGTSLDNELPQWAGGVLFFMPITDFSVIEVPAKGEITAISGNREMNVFAPILGNVWSTGDFGGPVFPASLGALLMAIFGQVSSVQTADAANPLGTAADLSSGSITISNPTSSAFLQILITAAAGTGMSLTVSGTTPNGDAVSEVIPITLDTGAVTVQTRYSYTGAITCVTAGFSSGAATVNGYTQAVHTFTLLDTPLSYTGINKGDVGRGSGEAGTYVGGLLTALSLEFDNGAEANSFNYTATWMGKAPTYASAPTLFAPLEKPMAAWNAALTLDGSAYKVHAGSLDFASGNDLIWAADGLQGPTFPIGGPWGASGSLTVLPEDETDWAILRDNTEVDIHMTFANPFDLLAAGVSKTLLIEMTRTYYMTGAESNVQGAQAIDINFTPIRDETDGTIKATLTNNTFSY